MADTWADKSRLKKDDIVIFKHPSINEMFIIKRISIVNQQTVRVLGDNPKSSLDSRLLGDIDKNLIQAKATAVFRKYQVNSL